MRKQFLFKIENISELEKIHEKKNFKKSYCCGYEYDKIVIVNICDLFSYIHYLFLLEEYGWVITKTKFSMRRFQRKYIVV